MLFQNLPTTSVIRLQKWMATLQRECMLNVNYVIKHKAQGIRDTSDVATEEVSLVSQSNHTMH